MTFTYKSKSGEVINLTPFLPKTERGECIVSRANRRKALEQVRPDLVEEHEQACRNFERRWNNLMEKL